MPASPARFAGFRAMMSANAFAPVFLGRVFPMEADHCVNLLSQSAINAVFVLSRVVFSGFARNWQSAVLALKDV